MITPDDFNSIAAETIQTLVGSSPLEVRAYSAKSTNTGVVIQVVFRPDTGEWSLLLAQEHQSDPPFELADVLRVTDCPEATWRQTATVISHEVDVSRRVLVGAAQATWLYGGAYLSGDAGAFTVARKDRLKRASEYTNQVKLAPVIALADSAWRDGDLGRVIDLLSTHRSVLPPEQSRRLTFAERKLGDEPE